MGNETLTSKHFPEEQIYAFMWFLFTCRIEVTFACHIYLHLTDV